LIVEVEIEIGWRNETTIKIAKGESKPASALKGTFHIPIYR